ncbi:HNH endonuclease [bacterium]|nr:HNH endonuclease [bacterium]
MYGKHLSAETKKKISIGKQGVSPAQWLGFIGNTDCMQRRAFQKTLQRRVFERDLYKCTICGVGGDLQVDHILSWAEHPALRFDMDNCRTLCAGCHYEVTFGRRMPSETRGWGHNLIKRSGVLVL